MSVFGSETQGGMAAYISTPRALAWGKYTLAESGAVTSIDIYTDCGAYDTYVKGCIWDDDGDSGKPGTLKGVSAERNLRSLSAGWYQLTFASPVALSAGNWWLGMISGGTTGAAHRYRDAADAG